MQRNDPERAGEVAELLRAGKQDQAKALLAQSFNAAHDVDSGIAELQAHANAGAGKPPPLPPREQRRTIKIPIERPPSTEPPMSEEEKQERMERSRRAREAESRRRDLELAQGWVEAYNAAEAEGRSFTPEEQQHRRYWENILRQYRS